MRPISTMNVIPFIDVMLVLLAVVLTTATFVAQGKIPVALPDAASADQLPVTQPIEITVSDDGAVVGVRSAIAASVISGAVTNDARRRGGSGGKMG